MSSSSYNPNITLTSLSTQQGEINLVTNPIAENDVSSWTTSSATLTRSTTGVLSPVIPTGFSASSTTSTTSYVQTSLLTVPASLRNRKLKVQLYIQCADTATWKVDVLKSDGSTRYTLSTDSSGVSALPALTGTYTTTFDMDTGSGIYVRLTRYAGSGTSTLSFTNLIVGPGIQPQGFAGQEWQAYSLAPTGGGSATFTYINRQFRRLGDSIEVYYVFSVGSAGSGTTAVTIPLPTNLNIDYTKAANETRLGSYSFLTTNYAAGGSIRSVTGVPTGVQLQEVGAATLITGADLTAGSAWYISFTAPIAEFSGSGTVQLAQNDVEWASNNSTSTSTDSTSFAYGPSGSVIQAFAPAGLSAVSKRVRFQTPIQVGDSLVLEASRDGGLTWVVFETNSGIGGIYSRNDAGTTAYGYLLNKVNSTDIDVSFFSAPVPGVAWNADATLRWRLRKSSAGAAVGFGIVQPGVSSGLVSASGLPANLTGGVIPTDYVGQLIQSTVSTNTNVGSSGTYFDLTSFTLTPGTWLINGYVIYIRNSATVSDTSAVIGLSATAGNNSTGAVQGTSWVDSANSTFPTNFGRIPLALPSVYCRYNGTTLTLPNGSTLTPTNNIFYLKGWSFAYSAGTPQYLCSFSAVRIA